MRVRLAAFSLACLWLIAISGTNWLAAAQTAGNAPAPAKPAKQPQPWKAGDAALFLTDGLAVDADGAPNSYLVDGKGLSYTCDGVEAIVDGKPVPPKDDPKSAKCLKAWADANATNDFSHVKIFGFLTDKDNRPIKQVAGDPLPDKAFMTITSMTVPGTPDLTQRHWVDATKIPYIVLPGSFIAKYRVNKGDLAVVYWPKKDKAAFAVFADGGGLGEASVKLHFDLGSNPILRSGGVDRAKVGIDGPILTVVFPGVNVPGSTDADDWNKRINDAGKASLEKWGSMNRLKACAGGATNACLSPLAAAPTHP